MTTQTVQLVGLDKLEAKLYSTKLLGSPLKGVLTDMGKLAQATAKSGAAHHTKISRRTSSISATVKALGADAATQEIGRKAGAKLPPMAVIRAWAETKGMPQTAAFPIARAIARRGLRGRFYMQKAKEVTEAALPARLLQMGLEVEQEFSQ